MKQLQIPVYLILLLLFSLKGTAGKKVATYTNPGNGNPLLPGYFADPTAKKFGDTYYIYATTDGIKLASGEPQVWISKDFVNWYNYEMDIRLPKGLTNCWAPDVLQAKDGRYYYFTGNCQFGCNIYGYVSDSPIGPWTPLNGGKPIIPAGTGKKDLPALDAQFLQDDDGSVTAFFGTWCTSFGGLGWADIDPGKMDSVQSEGYIPAEQLPGVFEAAYPVERDSIYFLMYSSGDCRHSSYAVHYAWAKNKYGPYHYGANNPILSSSGDGTTDGPGHHSIIRVDDNYYIVYHRHDNPHSTGGEFRQVCADKLIFRNDSTIEKIMPTHTGTGFLGKDQIPFKNIAFQSTTKATSFYRLVSGPTRYQEKGTDYCYLPGYAVDDNNGTMWKASSSKMPQSLVTDLGSVKRIKRIMTQFEYPTFYYQYSIEVSDDSTTWRLFSDKTGNRKSGSPMIDDHNTTARYVKITVSGTEKPGMFAAIWNIKIYDQYFGVPPFRNKESDEGPGASGKGRLLVDFNVKDEKTGPSFKIKNKGNLGGEFTGTGTPHIEIVNGIKSLKLDGKSYFTLSKDAPESLGWNSAFTAAAWVLCPEPGLGECILTWTSRENMLQASYAAMMYGNGNYGAIAHGDGAVDLPFRNLPAKGNWHHLAVTFDGMREQVYVDGEQDNQQPISLFVQNGKIMIGASGEDSENYQGLIASVRLYDGFLSGREVKQLMEQTKPDGLENQLIDQQSGIQTKQ